jgi:hypothetical protein
VDRHWEQQVVEPRASLLVGRVPRPKVLDPLLRLGVVHCPTGVTRLAAHATDGM